MNKKDILKQLEDIKELMQSQIFSTEDSIKFNHNNMFNALNKTIELIKEI